MEKALEILKHIEELYVAEPDLAKIERMAENNPERVGAWEEAFAPYDLADILAAIDDFWQFKNSKSRPNVAQITAVLTAKKVDTSDNSKQGLRARILKCADEHGDKWGAEARERYLRLARQQWPDVDLSGHEWTEPKVLGCAKQARTDYAADFMARDIRQGHCRHLFPVYNRAVRLIAEDRLSREIPASEWAKLSFAERCEKAMAIGLFNDFDNALIEVCRSYCGKDYQLEANPPKVNPSRAGGYIAAHYADNDIFDLSEGA